MAVSWGVVSGTAVVNERVFQLVGVRLRNRAVVWEARAHGPIPAGRADGYTLHDEDGAVVTRVTGIPIAWREVGVFDTLSLLLPIAALGREAKPAGVELREWPLMTEPPASS